MQGAVYPAGAASPTSPLVSASSSVLRGRARSGGTAEQSQVASARTAGGRAARGRTRRRRGHVRREVIPVQIRVFPVVPKGPCATPQVKNSCVLDSSRLSTSNQNPTILCSNKPRYPIVISHRDYWLLHPATLYRSTV
jgi:hypothetical protein